MRIYIEGHDLCPKFALRVQCKIICALLRGSLERNVTVFFPRSIVNSEYVAPIGQLIRDKRLSLC
jgi:hypothetical protein